MGFNKRKIESERAAVAAKEAAARRALGPQILADAKRLVAAWNARQEAHMPMLFAPTIGAAIVARYWFLWVRCPACRTTNSIDLRPLDRHPEATVTNLIPTLSCQSCRPHAPFAELVRLAKHSIADEMNVSRNRVRDTDHRSARSSFTPERRQRAVRPRLRPPFVARQRPRRQPLPGMLPARRGERGGSPF
jgi:hypothetical protein